MLLAVVTIVMRAAACCACDRKRDQLRACFAMQKRWRCADDVVLLGIKRMEVGESDRMRVL